LASYLRNYLTIDCIMTERHPYTGDLRRDFVEPLARSIAAPPTLRLIGPLPLFVFMHMRQQKRIGWRVLVLSGDRPLAAVDCGRTHNGRRYHSVHGTAAASALLDALLTMRRHGVPSDSLRVVQVHLWRSACVVGTRRGCVVCLPVSPLAGPPRRRTALMSLRTWQAAARLTRPPRRSAKPPI
jgi:hypothetical protein